MEESAETAIARVIETMRSNLDEQITIDDMARTALFSKFHFSRLFQRATGISPGRFLSALRIQKAKQLLISTSLTVTDISHRVGYASVSTFSTRFTSSVGVSPTTYRRCGGFAPLPDAAHLTRADGRAIIHGAALTPADQATGRIFVGLFPERMPQGVPVRCTVLPGPAPYSLENVPPGKWYVLAHGQGEFDSMIGCCGPIEITHDTVKRFVELELKPARVFDPPVLLALDTRSGVQPGPRTDVPMSTSKCA